METAAVSSQPSPVEDQSSGGFADSWIISLILGLVGLAVYWGVDFEFRSDDVALMVQGAETTTLGGILRAFSRPFVEIASVAFYRPLFSIDFMLMGKIFGDDPRPIGWLSWWLHGLAVVLGHRSLVALRLPASAAFIGTLLFACSPWAVNNVAWLVGRSTTVATITILAVFLLDQRSRRQGQSHSWPALLVLLFGLFYRETSALALLLIGLVYLQEGLALRQIAKRLLWLSCPVLLHLALRLWVIGALVGGYSDLDQLRHGVALETNYLNTVPDIFLRLFGAAAGDSSLGHDWRVYLAAALALLASASAFVWAARRRSVAVVLVVFALMHALPLILVDPSLHAGSSQRWHSVIWALTAVIGLGCAAMPRRSGWLVAVILVLLSAGRLRENLDDYNRSAPSLRSLRAAIERSAEPIILVHGLVPYLGCAPFFEVGVGQLLQPPFGTGEQTLFPLAMVAAHGPDARRMQTPLAAFLRDQGERFSPVWLDVEHQQVVDMSAADIDDSAALFRARPRLTVRSPEQNARTLLLDLDVEGVERLEIHFIAPLAEFVLHRRRGEGAFGADALEFQEDLGPLRDIGLHLDGEARGRCFLWLVGYDDAEDLREPIAVSEIIELQLEDLSP